MIQKYLPGSLCVLLLAISTARALERIVLQDERKIAHTMRIAAARKQTIARPLAHITQINPDEENIANYAGSFTKALEHSTGDSTVTTVGQENFEQLVKAMATGNQSDFNAINFASGNLRKFVNPQAAFTFSMAGCDSSLFTMLTPPSITSAEGAADMIETYLFMICRDVNFADYGTGTNSDVDTFNGGSLSANAAAILTALGDAYHGPRNGGVVDASVLFRGKTAGDLIGPMTSQFLLAPLYPLFPAGCAGFVAGLIGVANLNQDVIARPQWLPIAEKREFLVTWDDFVAVQNGHIPKDYEMTDYNQTDIRYPINMRDMGSYVHIDSPYEPYYNALNILAYRGFPISPEFPYNYPLLIKNETAGHNMGVPDAYALVGGVMLEAFKAAWAQKWRSHRRVRPEAFAGLVHWAKVNESNPYGINNVIFGTLAEIDFLAWVQSHNQLQSNPSIDPTTSRPSFGAASTYLLAQMYPEGSPVHPAYPSGHATVAGACTTVIKAIFNDQALIKDHFAPIKVDLVGDPSGKTLIELSGQGENEMTVASELDKLASNVAHARAACGVHFRSDGDEGMLLGEQVAIRYLQDHQRTYPEDNFNGYVLTKRDGTRIRITPDAVISL